MRNIFSRYVDMVVLALLVMVAFTGTALAAGELSPDQPLIDLAKPIFDAVVHGQWWIAAMSLLILTVAAAKKYAPTSGKLGWTGRALDSTPGVMACTFVLAFAGAVVTSLAALGPTGIMTLAVAKTALLIAVTAIGTWKALHSLAAWAIGTDFYKNKVPAWAQAIVAMVLALVGSNAIDKAQTAGQKAVDAKPSTGATTDDFTKF